MPLKRRIADFLCAFAVFLIVLVCLAALSEQSFFEGAVNWNGKEGALSVFGTQIYLDKRLYEALGVLMSFNEAVFGKGMLWAIKATADFFADYVLDGITLFFSIARIAVGAE